jgi:hypothetical protein
MQDRVTIPMVLPISLRIHTASGHIEVPTSAHHTRIHVSGIADTAPILVHSATAIVGAGEAIPDDSRVSCIVPPR